ncbi:hypothetical protein SeLEV6574_g03994 [Synchytrium endobioticum]|uniref:Uncharacterized protein n=1 Tax=Synchytrium endobioticum TaxID=286115 RepID=A0A507D1Q3_9FUNG|nr:hypothetical protein SeLEV6574_g03994 [Synchytrium endobioticum]
MTAAKSHGGHSQSIADMASSTASSMTCTGPHRTATAFSLVAPASSRNTLGSTSFFTSIRRVNSHQHGSQHKPHSSQHHVAVVVLHSDDVRRQRPHTTIVPISHEQPEFNSLSMGAEPSWKVYPFGSVPSSASPSRSSSVISNKKSQSGRKTAPVDPSTTTSPGLGPEDASLPHPLKPSSSQKNRKNVVDEAQGDRDVSDTITTPSESVQKVSSRQLLKTSVLTFGTLSLPPSCALDSSQPQLSSSCPLSSNPSLPSWKGSKALGKSVAACKRAPNISQQTNDYIRSVADGNDIGIGVVNQARVTEIVSRSVMKQENPESMLFGRLSTTILQLPYVPMNSGLVGRDATSSPESVSPQQDARSRHPTRTTAKRKRSSQKTIDSSNVAFGNPTQAAISVNEDLPYDPDWTFTDLTPWSGRPWTATTFPSVQSSTNRIREALSNHSINIGFKIASDMDDDEVDGRDLDQHIESEEHQEQEQPSRISDTISEQPQPGEPCLDNRGSPSPTPQSPNVSSGSNFPWFFLSKGGHLATSSSSNVAIKPKPYIPPEELKENWPKQRNELVNHVSNIKYKCLNAANTIDARLEFDAKLPPLPKKDAGTTMSSSVTSTLLSSSKSQQHHLALTDPPLKAPASSDKLLWDVMNSGLSRRIQLTDLKPLQNQQTSDGVSSPGIVFSSSASLTSQPTYAKRWLKDDNADFVRLSKHSSVALMTLRDLQRVFPPARPCIDNVAGVVDTGRRCGSTRSETSRSATESSSKGPTLQPAVLLPVGVLRVGHALQFNQGSWKACDNVM